MAKKQRTALAVCNDEMSFGDDHGDNETTFRCEKMRGHDGLHEEKGVLYGIAYCVSWKRSAG